MNPDLGLVEMVELNDHPYFVGCQFHPEFKSKPFRAAPAVRRLRHGGASPTATPARRPRAAVTKLQVGKGA